MSHYTLADCADEAGKETLNAYWSNGFSVDEITQIIVAGDQKVVGDAQVGIGEGSVNPDIRRSRVGWLTYNDLPWLYDRMGWILRKLNGQFFQFDITGFHEDFQFTIYQSTNQGKYDWHMDKGYSPDGTPPRKLSMVMMLSQPDEYVGGDLELMTGSEPIQLNKEQGIVHIFPSWVLHRVTPVTKGTRRSLVIWSCGKAFK